MIAEASGIDGLFVLRPRIIVDRRGFFVETFKASVITDFRGTPHRVAQSNHSRSAAKVLRGFHTETIDKMIYVTRGVALIVVADIRPESPTFGQHRCFTVGDPPGERLRVFVSEGLTNAFYCFTEVDYVNDVSREYEKTKRGGVRWNDPDLAIHWPVNDPILSDSDATLPNLRSLMPDHPALAATASS